MTKTNKIISWILTAFLFTQIAVIPAFAETTNISTTKTPKLINLACMKSAVEKREIAVEIAYDIYTTNLKTSLQNRRIELLAAWDIADKTQRRTAINNAWNNFKAAKNTANQTFRTTKQESWKQFQTDKTACKITESTGESQSNEIS